MDRVILSDLSKFHGELVGGVVGGGFGFGGEV